VKLLRTTALTAALMTAAVPMLTSPAHAWGWGGSALTAPYYGYGYGYRLTAPDMGPGTATRVTATLITPLSDALCMPPLLGSGAIGATEPGEAASAPGRLHDQRTP
jgi:hypothetical protein